MFFVFFFQAYIPFNWAVRTFLSASARRLHLIRDGVASYFLGLGPELSDVSAAFARGYGCSSEDLLSFLLALSHLILPCMENLGTQREGGALRKWIG